MTGAEDHVLDLGRWPLTSGYSLPETRLAYRTFGTLNAAKDNAVLVGHPFAGTPATMTAHVGPGLPLDPATYFVIVPGQFGAGWSSSPSNTPVPYDRGQFPAVSIVDDVLAQHHLLTEHLGIQRLHAAIGWSTGAQQTYEWAARYSPMVPRAAVFAATAQTSAHQRVFLDTALELLRSDPEFANGFYREATDVRVGLARLAVAFSLMGFSPAWYRQEEWRTLGYVSPEDFRQGFVRGMFAGADPNDLVRQAEKWRGADIAPHGRGSLPHALGRIKGHFFVVPFDSDQLAVVDECADDAGHLPHGELRVIESPAGHMAMAGLLDADTARIHQIMAEVLAG